MPILEDLSRLKGKLDGLLLEQAFVRLSRLGQFHPNARPEKHGVEVIKDVPYRDSALVEHRLDVYRPIERKGPLPVVLYVHGGAFCILSKETHWIMALAFARRGYVVFNINYRLAPRHKFPAGIEDVCRCYEWLGKNVELWGGDPERITLAGESAGANLVTALSIATSYERPEPWARAAFEAGIQPKAVVPACGLFQVTDTQRFERMGKFPRWLTRHLSDIERHYLGGVEHAHERALDLANPLSHLERGETPARPLPRYFVGCGTKDVLLDDSRRLKAALDRTGATCKLVVYPGELHAFNAFVWRDAAKDYWNQCHGFLGESFAPSPAFVQA
jgi:acetyl esterase